jgi:microcystin degradation protein MlrC
MRVAIGGISLESVSFLQEIVSLEEFRSRESAGQKLLDDYRGTNTVIGGFLKVMEPAGADLVPLVYTTAGAAGLGADDAFVHYVDRICAGLQAALPVDGVLLALHGAMATPTRLDPEREVTERVRAVVGRKVPVMVALDYHGNIDDSLLRVADAVFGYHFSPHVDMGWTGERTATCLLRTLRGAIRPVCALAKPGVMVPSIFSATSLPPLSEIVQDSIDVAEQSKTWLDVSVFAGFSYADVPNCGFSVLAVADGNQALADGIVREFSERIRRQRHELVHREMVLGMAEGIAEARRLAANSDKPVVILEHADRMNDSTHILREVLRLGLKKVAVPFLYDPEAAAKMVAAGEGAVVTVEAGGRSDPRAGGPVTLTGKLLFAGEKSFRTTGPMGHGKLVDLGPTAVIDVDGVVVWIVSHRTTAIDEDCFTQFGMMASDFDIIVLRSKTHFRAVYEKVAAAILIVDTPDWGPADLTTLPYRHVPTDRIFPFVEEPA